MVQQPSSGPGGEELARQTFRLDSARSIMAGTSEAFVRTFFLLIALQAFRAPKIDKSLIACAGGLGLLASPLVASVVTKWQCRVSRAASIMVLAGGALLVLPLLFHNLYVYVACVMGAIAVVDGIAVLMAPIHAANYPAGTRKVCERITNGSRVFCCSSGLRNWWNSQERHGAMAPRRRFRIGGMVGPGRSTVANAFTGIGRTTNGSLSVAAALEFGSQ